MTVQLLKRLQAFAELVNETSILKYIEEIWANDRLFTYPKFHATARKVTARLREFDVRPRVFEIPADGKTVLGDWKMPLGWDCKTAVLEIHEPFEERGRVLGDRKKSPCHVIMWSGSTPEKGVIADVVRVEDAADAKNKKADLKDKIVYTPVDPRGFKKVLFDAGAVGVVTSYSPSAKHVPDAVFWVNGWSDQPGGWAFHAGDAPLPGMVISPEVGVELEILMDRGPVKLKMNVESSYKETTMPVVCGYIDAPVQEEIMAIGHLMEQGANDNASGAAVIMECLRAIQEGTQDGSVVPLRRAVRGLMVNECYGTIGFAAENPGILRRITAGINLDTLGRHHENVNGLFKHHRCPDAVASVVDTLLVLLMDAWFPRNAPFLVVRKENTFSLTDNAYNDPLLGVHCPYIDSQDRYWHTSADTMDKLSGPTLHAWATVTATWMHFLATATAEEAMWLAQQTVRRYGEKMESLAGAYAITLADAETDKPAVLAKAIDHLMYIKEIADKAVMSAKRFMLKEERAQGHLDLLKLNKHTRRLLDLEKKRLKDIADCEPGELEPLEGIDDIAELRPYKKFIGTPAYDSLPPEARAKAGSPTWNGQLHCALFWSEGKLTFAEIARRIGYEFGKAAPQFLAKHFKVMGEHDLIQWLQPGEKIPKPPAIKTDEDEEGSGFEDEIAAEGQAEEGAPGEQEEVVQEVPGEQEEEADAAEEEEAESESTEAEEATEPERSEASEEEEAEENAAEETPAEEAPEDDSKQA